MKIRDKFYFLTKYEKGKSIKIIVNPVEGSSKYSVISGTFDGYGFMHPQYSKSRSIFLTQLRDNKPVQVAININNVQEVREDFVLPGKSF